ncbi:cytochrome P450 CYP94D108-like [Aristolochia californica]|uniref:cytochrome P450 CYP94D108-like n=1 Tax=Aristolochia californica TaxID=171875 RepID=UPI0035D810AF
MELPGLLQSLFFFLIFLYLLLFFHGRRYSSVQANSIGLTSYPVVGFLPDFIKNRHRFLDWMTEILILQPTNSLTLQRAGDSDGIITANPMNIEHMLKTNFENYPKGKRFASMLQDFLGHGIFISDGEQWKAQRKTASFEFNTKSLRNFVMDAVRFEVAERLVPLLERAAGNQKILDLQDILERFAFDNVCKLAFNEDPGCLAGDGTSRSGFVHAFDDAANISAARFMYAFPIFWKIKKFLNVGSERRLRESINTVHGFATEIIRTRRAKMKKGIKAADEDLLSRFMASYSDSGEEVLRDMIVSFILAGRDTTSSGLSWFFWMLASRPDVEKNILNEIKSVRTLHPNSSGETFSIDQLREMHYLHAAISEAMRLYPPVPFDSKECLKDDMLPDGTFIRKGWFISYCSYSMGRMQRLWGPDCLNYKPERWLEKGVFRAESQFKYPVFHAGPRICLGKEMAYIQMKSIVACVLERFEVEVLEKEKRPEFLLSLTLRMKGGLPARVRRRSLGDMEIERSLPSE